MSIPQASSGLNVIAIIALLGLGACTTGTIRVDSSPEAAEVQVSIAGQPPRKIGQTPFNLVENTLGIGGESVQLIISKEGYNTENILVPPGSFARSTTVRVVLKEVAAAGKALNEQTLQKVASGVALAQNMIKSKQYDQAETTLQSLATQFPGVPTFHELLGNVHYLRKDLTRALSAYRKAYELNPSNVDTQRMIFRIEAAQGVRSPAAEGGR